ncbi:chaperone protein dnaJ-like protein [Wolffia australiana]
MAASSSSPAAVSALNRLLSPPSPSPQRWNLGMPGRRSNLGLRAGGSAPLRQQFEARPSDEDGENVGEDSWRENAVILCDGCKGNGWLLCDFCKGQKINVKSETNRIYRRCPSCKAVGYVLCPSCKVFKCITFPDYEDGQM